MNMARMIRIDRTAPASEPLLHIYQGRVVLNDKASSLLCLNDGDRVDFLQDEDEMKNGRDRIYICRAESPRGYVGRMRGRTCRINSASLTHSLLHHLPGYGTYRICPEVNELVDGVVYYNIFFRKYECNGK